MYIEQLLKHYKFKWRKLLNKIIIEYFMVLKNENLNKNNDKDDLKRNFTFSLLSLIILIVSSMCVYKFI